MVDLFFKDFEKAPPEGSDSSFTISYEQHLEYLLNIYRTGDINLINQIISSGDSIYNEASLSKRNKIFFINPLKNSFLVLKNMRTLLLRKLN